VLLKSIKHFQKRTAVNKDDSRKGNSFPARIVVCMLATKGGVTMYDYMKALQERFDEKQLEHLVYAVQSAREGLRDGIDAESRRKLLRLLDAQNALLVEAKLMSFTAGFKLAAGIAGELGAPYSFDADEEEKAKEMITNG
jgi:hypothetical protein